MVRTHSHEIVADKYGNYNEEMIDKAIQDREKGPSLRKAAEKHGVPLSALARGQGTQRSNQIRKRRQ